jgi:hypothetical protein
MLSVGLDPFELPRLVLKFELRDDSRTSSDASRTTKSPGSRIAQAKTDLSLARSAGLMPMQDSCIRQSPSMKVSKANGAAHACAAMRVKLPSNSRTSGSEVLYRRIAWSLSVSLPGNGALMPSISQTLLGVKLDTCESITGPPIFRRLCMSSASCPRVMKGGMTPP